VAPDLFYWGREMTCMLASAATGALDGAGHLRTWRRCAPGRRVRMAEPARLGVIGFCIDAGGPLMLAPGHGVLRTEREQRDHFERGDNPAELVCGGHRRLNWMRWTDYSPLEASTRASRKRVLTCSRLSL
jgi:hypothetical protein